MFCRARQEFGLFRGAVSPPATRATSDCGPFLSRLAIAFGKRLCSLLCVFRVWRGGDCCLKILARDYGPFLKCGMQTEHKIPPGSRLRELRPHKRDEIFGFVAGLFSLGNPVFKSRGPV